MLHKVQIPLLFYYLAENVYMLVADLSVQFFFRTLRPAQNLIGDLVLGTL